MMRWILPIVAVACSTDAPSNDWTRTAALAGVRAQLDRDEDGRVDVHEYSRTVYAAPPFSEIDKNGNGDLDPDELDQLLADQDPSVFDRRPEPHGVNPEVWRRPFSGDPAARLRLERLAFLVDEVQRSAPDTSTPDPEEQRRMATDGGAPFARQIELLLEVLRRN